MTAVNLNAWLDCTDEMDMDSFIQQFDDERALRAFAILNAKSVLEHLVDQRSTSAVTVAESYLAGDATIDELSDAYALACAAMDSIEAAQMSDDDPTYAEAITENAAYVALWAAYPVGYADSTPLESARDSALHTAYYCFQIWGDDALDAQIKHFKRAGLG